MKYRTLVLISLAMTAASGVFSQDAGDVKPRREMEDPSYEPSRSSVRKPKPAPEKTSAQPQTEINSPPVQAEVQVPSGPRVKYILDGKPYYEGDLPVVGPAKKDSSASIHKIESPAIQNSPRVAIEAPPVQSGPRVKYILDGKPVYDGDAPPAPGLPAARTQEFAPVVGVGTRVNQAATILENDLTADKPGTAAAAENQSLLEAMEAPGRVNSRAKKCYGLLVELKANVETIARCLDHRGKENASLIHASEVVSKNISDMAAIWPGNEEFTDRCTNTKRCALIFNDELSQSPWKWAQVRWSFDALLKDVRGFRDFCRVLADAERPPRAIVDNKGNVTYIDEPDPFLVTVAGQRAAKLKLDQEEIAKRRNFEEARDEKKDAVKSDLDGHEIPTPGRSKR